jgi:ABC-type cobalt transport system substrate-binding protein
MYTLDLTDVVLILLIHLVADFVFQSEQWALNKSKAWSPLLKHTATYSSLWFLPMWLMSGALVNALLFVVVTFVAHTTTDYFTSRVVSKQFAAGHYGSPIPNFGAFSTIGVDQVLHYIQLFVTYLLIIK